MRSEIRWRGALSDCENSHNMKMKEQMMIAAQRIAERNTFKVSHKQTHTCINGVCCVEMPGGFHGDVCGWWQPSGFVAAGIWGWAPCCTHI